MLEVVKFIDSNGHLYQEDSFKCKQTSNEIALKSQIWSNVLIVKPPRVSQRPVSAIVVLDKLLS